MTLSVALAFYVQAASGLVSIANPIGAVPLFLSMTEGVSRDERRAAARQATIAVALILVAAALFGGLILKAFGLSLDAFRAGGGLVIVLMGLEMLRGEKTKVQNPPQTEEQLEDTILVPFAMPMVAGPGSIATTMTLAAQAQGPWGHIALFGAIATTVLALGIALRSARRVDAALGPRGQRILLRFMGLVLLTLGVQFLLSGARDFLVGHPG